MKKSKMTFLIGITIIVCILITTVIVSYKSIKPSASNSDIVVEGVLQPNNTGVNDYKGYLLSIKMTKKKDCHIAVYPYIGGLGQMSFSEKDRDDSFLPGSVGSDGVTEPIAINELKSKKIIEDGKDVSLIGFWFPDVVGQYKARLYLDKLDTFKEIKNPVLVCVYTEKKYGKQLTWSKVVPIIIQ